MKKLSLEKMETVEGGTFNWGQFIACDVVIGGGFGAITCGLGGIIAGGACNYAMDAGWVS